MFKFLFLIFVVLFNLSFSQETKNLLILHSYHQSSSWVKNMQRGIEENLDRKNFEINLYIENMDTKRHSEEEYYAQLKKIYKLKYKDIKLDAIISSDNNAFNFLREYRDELFGEVPVSFMGVNFFKQKDLDGHTLYTGVAENEDFDASIKLMKKINPNLEKVFITADYLTTGIITKEKIKKIILENNYNLKFEFNENVPFEKLLDKVSSLEEQSAILVGLYFKDSTGKNLEPNYTAKQISKVAKVPVYTMFDIFHKNGVLGGNMVSSYMQGKLAVEKINAIFQGKDIKDLPITFSGSNENIFDFEVLQRFDIDESILPKDSKVLNKSLSNLTKEEINWILMNPKVVVGAESDWVPFDFINKFGEYDGITKDILALISKNTGLKFDIRSNLDWNGLVEEFKVKKIDILPAIYYTKPREEFGRFTAPYVKINEKIFVNENSSFYELKDLQKATFAGVKGYKNIQEIKQELPDITIVEVKTINEALELLKTNKVDAFIDSEIVVEFLLKEKGISGIRKISQYITGVQDLRMLINKDKPILHSIIEKSLEGISQKDINDIKVRWSNSELVFTEKEQEWIEKQIPLEYVYDINWAPFEWKNELGLHAGILKDILTLIEEKSGIVLKEVETKSWNEALEVSKTDKVDMFSGVNISKNLDPYMKYTSNSIYSAPYVFVARESDKSEYFDGFDAVIDKKVGVVGGYYIDTLLKENNHNIKYQTVKNVKEGFEKVQKSELDVMIVNLATAKYFINHESFGDLKVVAKTKYSMDLKIALKKTFPSEVVSILDKSIGAISQDELNAIYNKWTNLQTVEEIDWVSIFEVVGIALVILGFLYINNRKLKSMVEEKTQEVKKLLTQFDKNIIASEHDQDGITTYVSEALCKISGYKKEELIGEHYSIFLPKDTIQEEIDTIEALVLKGEAFSLEKVQEMKKDGSIYYVKAYITPKKDKFGNIIGRNAIRQDITSQVEVEELSKTLEEKVIERTKELDDEKNYTSSVLNAQTNIVIATDGKTLKTANQAFLDFYDVKNVDEFMEKFGNCICDTFGLDENYIQKMMGEEKWIDYVFLRPQETHKVKIKKDDEEYIFTINAAKFFFKEEELKVAVFNDITEIEKIKIEIEKIHKNTKSSIEYASLIQHGIVPEDRLLEKYFSDSFAFWEPKDIVGGDIYLFDAINEDECLLYVIDCTGHGVPGAFVTMLVKAIERQVSSKINHNTMEQISPAWILSYFNRTIKILLSQDNKDSLSNAGFDGGIIYYNKKQNIIKFAGAETPLFYMQDDELQMIKGSRHSVGYKKSDINFEFKEHTLEIKEGMKFYLTTDGYLDQNGGEKGFCMGKTKFKNIIIQNNQESFSLQKERFQQSLKEYQNSYIRNDDVTVVAFKI